MPQLTIDLTELGLPVADASGWVEAVDSLGNPMPVVTTGTGALVFGARALDFDTAGRATIDLPATDGLQPAGARYRAYLTRRDATTVPVAVGPFALTADADLGEVADLPPSDVLAAFEEVIASAQAVLDAIGPVADLAGRVDDVNDHEDVSGRLTLQPSSGYHVFNAIGPTTIDLGPPPGNSIAFKAITGADQVTVDGLPDLTLTDNAWTTFVFIRGAWDLASTGSSGGGSVEPVTDPPTQPGAVTVTPTNDGYTLSWVASTVAAGYEVQLDNGAWVNSGIDTAHTYTGLAAGSEHSGAVRAYNSLGVKSATRTWGPESVNTVGLHEQLLALEPTYYLRTSRGSLESFGAESGWAFTNGTPNFTGPALVDGESGSVMIDPAGCHLLNNNAVALNGATGLTVIAVLQPTNTVGGRRVFNAYPLAEFGFTAAPAESYFNEYSRGAQTHTFAATKGAGQINAQWRDGVGVNVDNQAFASGSSPQDGDAYIGAWFAGGGAAFYLSHLAVFVNEVLPPETIAALAQAAGTAGNPA